MKSIDLTDTEAHVTSITWGEGFIIVELEWGGPKDRTLSDFDLDKLGCVFRYCEDHRRGWVTLDGECNLGEGDTIPLKQKIGVW